jgi:hypothetical protein
MTDLKPVVQATRYTVNCMPEGAAPDAHVFALHVDLQRDGSWVVHDGFQSLRADGTWSDEYGPHGLGEGFRHTQGAALRLATEAAPHVRVNGMTPADALARIERLREERS